MAGDRESQKKPPLSCTSCRARKLKCDKQSPCRNCERSGSECVFPARKRIQRPRKTKNAELLQRLNRLEAIVGRVGLANLEDVEARVDAVDAPTAKTIHPPVETESGPLGDRAPYDLKAVRPPHDSTASRYMSGEFWSSLCDEVGGLRHALEQSTDSDDEDDNEGTTPESVGGGSAATPTAPGMLLGSQRASSSQAIEHPSPEHIRYLASVFFMNVDMHLKILHRPTILDALSNLANNPDTAPDLSPELTALFFAIYYAAITSLAPEACARNLGRSRSDLAGVFQAGIEQALVRADYLNSTRLEPLQALTLYTCCLRSHNGSRASWALLGLAIRLAQAAGIHQDGEGGSSAARQTPFEAEQRRRLWWQLIVLDIRAAEDRGTGTVIARGSYDTRLPHNLDDGEFGPATSTPLRDRPGPSDATFSLFTAQSSGIFLGSEYARQNVSEEETVRRARHLEAQFVRGADPRHVGSYFASVTVRLIVLKMWLVMRYPLHPRGGDSAATRQSSASSTLPPASAGEIAVPEVPGSASGVFTTPTATTSSQGAAPAVSRQSTLRTALSIMELSEFLETGPYSDRFRWWSETYVQWHPLAVALAELCSQTQGDLVEHAWQVIEVVFPRWSDKIADEKRGNLWRPIRKLYKKAKAARAAALSADEGARQSRSQPQSIWGTSASVSTADPQLSGLEPAIDYMAIDPSLTAGSGSIRPRLITDMILSESSAHTLTSGSPMPYTKIASIGSATTNTDRNQDSEYSRLSGSRINTQTSTEPDPFNFGPTISDPGQSTTQALPAWPDVSFDLPVMSAGGYDVIPSQAPASAMTGAGAGDGSILTDPSFLDTTTMDWSTWDEFVLDTYADSTPKSGSGGSEGGSSGHGLMIK